jgi:hypothetical protein
MRIHFLIALSGLLQTAYSFGVTAPSRHCGALDVQTSRLFSTDAPDDPATTNPMTKQDKKSLVGNLVADDEWEGLGMELSELVRVAVIEDLKKNAREFIGKDEYKIGDISKQIDTRVKGEVALLRGKDEYELGDFVLAMDEMSKKMTEDLTGQAYQAGDLSVELDRRVKMAAAKFCGKENYEFGDLANEIDVRVKDRVYEFTGNDDYEFGDISKEVENRRKAWVKDFLGDEAAEDYEFGDITKKAVSDFTGKDGYEFGDITKKLAGNLLGKRKRRVAKKDDDASQ